MNDKLKIAILSTAHVHAEGWAETLWSVPEAELITIYDDDPSRGQPVADRFGVPFTAHLHEALASVDAVFIAAENSRHPQLTLAAAAAGKHILCEKPLAITAADGVRMITACRDAGVQLGTAFNCRFLQPVVRAKQLIDAGKIGRVLAIKATNHGYLPPGWFTDPEKSGGGAVIDHTVHVADLMRWFLHAEVTSVYAEVGTLFHDLPVDDAGLLSLEFDNGVFATLDTSWSRGAGYYVWGDVTMEIIGTAGTLSLDAFAQHLKLYDHGRLQPRTENWGGNYDLPLVSSFVQAIRDGRPVPVTGLDGLRAAEVAFAAYESARQHAPVRLVPATVG
ncbi:MAG: dehydrogenase [Firmicutes bacterium]|nr:dehydrogenase [Bacillota bacterium]